MIRQTEPRSLSCKAPIRGRADGDTGYDGIGVAIPFSSMGRYLGFTTLPPIYWPLLALTPVRYVVRTQPVKMWLLRRHWF